jgi:DNA-binding SARP family transcriptional activator
MNTLHVKLFGKICNEQDGQPAIALSAKAQELLCYLILQRDRAHTRESLSDLLWPGASCALAKKYLRQTLWQLQVALEGSTVCDLAESEALLILNPGWVRLNPTALLHVDVYDFEQAFMLCRDLSGHDLTDPQAHMLTTAINLYQGDLLETWYQDWCIYERERLQLTYLGMLEKLMGYCEARQRYAEGVAYGQRILRCDPARECTHRQLMRLYYLAGDRTGALHQFERCASALAKEFNLQPSQETVALCADIRADRLSAPGLHRRVEGTVELEPFYDLRQQLGDIQMCLSKFQNQVQQELASIRQAFQRELETLRQTSRQTPQQTP